MNNEQKIREACIKANPEIVKLKFGCEVLIGRNKKTTHLIWDYDKENRLATLFLLKEASFIFTDIDNIKKIIGRPLTLADVLLAMSKAKIVPLYSVDYYGIFWKGSTITRKTVMWNLKDNNLENQSEETKKFIADLL